jgi:hypothetical protein
MEWVRPLAMSSANNTVSAVGSKKLLTENKTNLENITPKIRDEKPDETELNIPPPMKTFEPSPVGLADVVPESGESQKDFAERVKKMGGHVFDWAVEHAPKLLKKGSLKISQITGWPLHKLVVAAHRFMSNKGTVDKAKQIFGHIKSGIDVASKVADGVSKAAKIASDIGEFGGFNSMDKILSDDVTNGLSIRGGDFNGQDIRDALYVINRNITNYSCNQTDVKALPKGGIHMLPHRCMSNDGGGWGLSATTEMYWRINIDSSNKSGPAVIPGSLLTTASTLTTGGDVGAVSTVMRTKLDVINAEINLIIAKHRGFAINNNRGTSRVSSLTKLLLYLASSTPMGMSGDWLVANQTWRPDTPFIAGTTGADAYPLENWAVVPPFVGLFEACIVSGGDFCRILDGTLDPTVVGFEVKHWGQLTEEGVAIVFINQSGRSDGDVNFWTVMSKMAYPLAEVSFDGTLRESRNGNLIAGANDVPASPITGKVAIAGPGLKVLFVVADQMNSSSIAVKIGQNGVDAIVTSDLNYVSSVGATSADWSAVVTAAMGGVTWDTSSLISAINRWREVGNVSDWENAMLILSEFYGVYDPLPRKMNQTSEGTFVYNGTGNPFVVTDHTAYNIPTNANVTDIHYLLSTATGQVCDSLVNIRNGGGSWTMRNTDIMVEFALFSRIIRYSVPLAIYEKDIFTPGGLCSKAMIMNLQMALVSDLLSQKMSIAERSLFGRTTLTKRHMSDQMLKIWQDKLIYYLKQKVSIWMVRPLWPVKTRGVGGYDRLFAVSKESMCITRTITSWVEKMISVPYQAHKDVMTFKGRERVMTRIGLLKYDSLSDSGVKEFNENPEKEMSTRMIFSLGSMTITTQDYTQWKICAKNGTEDEPLCFPCTHPTDTRAFYYRWTAWNDFEEKGDLVSIPSNTLPLMIDTEHAMRKKYVTVHNQRKLFLGETDPMPLIMSREHFGTTVLDEDDDDETVEISELKEFRMFQF